MAESTFRKWITSILKENGYFAQSIEVMFGLGTPDIYTSKNGGKIVLVGVSMAPISVPMVMPVMGEVSMKGAIGYKEEEFDDVIELLRLRKLDVVKYIDDIIPIDAANSAFERLTNMDNDAIKIIFKPNN